MALKDLLKNAQSAFDRASQATTVVKNVKEKIADIQGESKKPVEEKAVKEKNIKDKDVQPVEVVVTEPKKDGPREIDTLEGMNDWLSELQAGASESVQQALKAQMQVISFVQSPTLVDTTIDTLVLNLKKSLECESSDEMRKKIHERFSLMIQNYVFFLDARMQMEINANKQEANRLCNMAGEMLSQSVVDVAMLAVPGAGAVGALKGVSGVVVKNVFAENSPESSSFFSGLLKLIMNNQSEKIAEFYKTVYAIITKLDKYSDLIGKSMLISGMIERYTPNLVDFEFPQDPEISYQKSLLDKVIDLKEQIVGKKADAPKLLRPNKKLIALNEDLYTIEQDLADVQTKLDELNKKSKIVNLLGAHKQERMLLEANITELQTKKRTKEKEIREEKIYAKSNFENSLLDIAKKFNEL